MDRGRGFNRGIGNFRGGRGRGMMRGSFGNGPSGRGMMRGSRGGPGRGGPIRMGLGYINRGGPRGRGRGGYGNNSDYNQAPPNENNIVATSASSEGTEKPVSAAVPVTTQSGNNVQVVTTGPPAQIQQTSQGPPSQSAPIQSNSSMGNSLSSRGSGFRGRGFGSRGGFNSRGRGGGFNQSMPPRQQFDTRQPSNLTQTMPPKMNRYDQQGSMPPKRGRYDSGPYMGSRNMPPNQPPPMTPQHHQSSYSSMPSHGTSGYQDQSQYVDQYQHGGYNSGVQSQGTYSANGGYNQSYGAQNSQLGYQQSEYDHSSTGYQDYSQSSYDTRGYSSGYSQDYRQSYNGSTEAGSYGQVAPDSSYSYEARPGYGAYDSSYSQSYNSQSGYY